MGILVNPSDFIGKWAIPNSGVDTLTETIAYHENEYLNNLLGGALNKYFQTLLPVGGLPPDYAFIYNEFSYNEGCHDLRSRGMKVMLLNFIWFETMRRIKFKATNEGIVVNTPDSAKESATGTLWYYYNDAIDTYAAIQIYIKTINPGAYTTTVVPSLENPSGNVYFKGSPLQRTIPLFGL